jgi:hypothetical protein
MGIESPNKPPPTLVPNSSRRTRSQ